MKHLQYLLFVCSSAFALATFCEKAGKKEGIEVWITTEDGISKLKPQNIQFVPTSSYIMLRTECHPDESVENEGQSNKKEKNKGKLRFIGGSSGKVIKKYYIHYLIENNLKVIAECQDVLNRILNYVVELFFFLTSKSTKEVEIFRESFEIQTSEFILHFSHFLGEQRVGTAESSRNSKSELETNMVLQNLYRINGSNIKEIPFSYSELTSKHDFVADAGTELVVVFNEDRSNPYTTNFVKFIKRYKRIEKVYRTQNYLHLKLLNLLNVFKENQFISIEEIIQNIIMKQTNEKKNYILYEYEGRKFTRQFNTNTEVLNWQVIQERKSYILHNVDTNEIFLYMPPNLESNTMKENLFQAERFFCLNKTTRRLTIVQCHKLNPSFIIAFENLISFFENDDPDSDIKIRRLLCKY